MHVRKLWFAMLLAAGPSVAMAQPSVSVDVGVSGDAYDSTAPGVPVESVDVFYDQLAPYGVWVDEPTVGHVFIPEEDAFVPYTNGHWQYTSVGFVWVASEPFAQQTSHYGRWSYSQPYARWVWLPDTEWGPSWVEWRESGDDFGWAPLAPEVVVRGGYAAPVESWHYCGAVHVLDENPRRYYEPRERVAEIHRAARPMEHYATVGNVRVVVGPPRSVLVAHHIEARPAKLDVHATGRIASAREAHAQVVHAQARRPQLEVQNKQRIESNVKLKAVVAKQPVRAVEPARREEPKPGPARTEPKKPEPARPVPARPEPTHAAPKRLEPARPEPALRQEPNKTEQRPAPARREEPKKVEPPAAHREPARREEPTRKVEPPAARPEPARREVPMKKVEPPPAPRVEPRRAEPAPAPHVEPNRAEPAPKREPAHH